MPHFRRPLTVVLAVLAALSVVTTPALAAPKGPERGLTVLSFNIHHARGVDGVLDLDRIARVIRDSRADVVALQEVDRHWSERSEFADQAAELAGALRMDHVYGANLDREPAQAGQPRRQYGTAVLSRFPIRESRNTLLPTLGGEQRGLLEARIKVRGQDAIVASTHLQHNHAAERAAQSEAIVDLLGSRPLPVILAGDLNARPGAPELEPIESSFTDLGGPGFTFPAQAPNAKIDYIFGNDRVRARSADVLRTQASDHLPVRSRVLLTAPYAYVRSLDRAHAHNDYEHRRPLHDTLHHGFTSVEADVWLQDGELRVAHDLVDTVPGRTLESLYLDPLAEITKANRGRVYPDRAEPVQLLVDIKSDGPATYTALDKTLRSRGSQGDGPYPMLTRYGPSGVRPGAVDVVVSGNRPRELMASQPERLAGYDGRLGDLDGAPADFIPLISGNWTNNFTWRGIGPMPAPERSRLEQVVGTAHGDGQRVRFWATPDQPGGAREDLWRELLRVDVDHIISDDLPGLRDFLLASS